MNHLHLMTLPYQRTRQGTHENCVSAKMVRREKRGDHTKTHHLLPFRRNSHVYQAEQRLPRWVSQGLLHRGNARTSQGRSAEAINTYAESAWAVGRHHRR